jgi:hypothetical protein
MTSWATAIACSALSAVACVSYDPTGPHAQPINGTFDATLVTILRNDLETREDTSVLRLTLRDSLYRGRFTGFYRFSDGDSSLVDGTLFEHGRIEVSHFGPWPPLTHVTHLSNLYPSCSFPALGPIYVINGGLVGDTLTLGASSSLPCLENLSGQPAEQVTTFEFRLSGLRRI